MFIMVESIVVDFVASAVLFVVVVAVLVVLVAWLVGLVYYLYDNYPNIEGK